MSDAFCRTAKDCLRVFVIWGVLLLNFSILNFAFASSDNSASVVYIGKFEPFHQGHLDAIKVAKEKWSGAQINLIPLKGTLASWFTEEMIIAGTKDMKDIIIHQALDGSDSQGLRNRLKNILMKSTKGQNKKAEVHVIVSSEVTDQSLQNAIKNMSEREIVSENNLETIGSVARRDRNLLFMNRIADNPLLNESLMPSEVADIVKKKQLFGRSQRRGYYDLPKSVTALLDYEQTLNDKIENTKEFASIKEGDLDPKFNPEMRPIFKLQVVLVPLEDVEIAKTLEVVPAELLVKKGGKSFLKFFYHPESESFFADALKNYERGETLLATPTASHRSIIAWNPETKEKPLYLKVSLNKNIGSNVRLLSRNQIERATAVSLIINSLNKDLMASKGMVFIDEPFSAYLKKLPFGYTLRHLPSVPEGSELIPMFSLYSKPLNDKPLIVKLAAKSGKTPKDFVFQQVIRPLVSHAVELALTEGLIGEPHEQNVLVELRNGALTGRFWYRDLAGFIISPKLRQAVGKGMDFIPPQFKVADMKFDRANLVDNFVSYLRQSNFYSLQKAMQKYFPEVRSNWVEQQALRTFFAEVYLRTGLHAEQLKSSKGALTKHINKAKSLQCVKIMGAL